MYDTGRGRYRYEDGAGQSPVLRTLHATCSERYSLCDNSDHPFAEGKSTLKTAKTSRLLVLHG